FCRRSAPAGRWSPGDIGPTVRLAGRPPLQSTSPITCSRTCEPPMIPPLNMALGHIFNRQDLTADEMQAAVAAIMDGQAGEAEIAAFLTALRMKGESVGELVGAARAMRERATRITTDRRGLLDTCGTGGDGLR